MVGDRERGDGEGLFCVGSGAGEGTGEGARGTKGEKGEGKKRGGEIHPGE
jgi:hypothetical protein